MSSKTRIFNGLEYKSAGSFPNITIDQEDKKIKEFNEKGYTWRTTQSVVDFNGKKEIVTEFWTKINNGKY